jgi:dinuclear metal center YbgI/SA1388 family protein
MKIKEVIRELELLAPLALQEDYDNAGLIVGDKEAECKGILVCLDVTEKVKEEAIEKNCNFIVAHHPIIFKGLKKINGKNYVERSIISAIKNDIALYAIHTNLDNLLTGVNDKIAKKLGLQNCKVLRPKNNLLKKLVTFCPLENAESIKNALFEAGAGNVGNYSECSFNLEGKGTFKGSEESNPFIGEKGKRHSENETRIEVIFPVYLQQVIIENLKKNHPYEEVAYYISSLDNDWQETGSGLVGELAGPITEQALFTSLKNKFDLTIVRHSAFLNKKVKKIALCGGSGFFLLPNAIAAGADAYITGDVKYHEFFDADGKILLADIGHFESEQFTIELLAEFLQNKYPNFAVQKTEINTNSVNYFI